MAGDLMDSSNLTAEQAEQIHRSLCKLSHYLYRLTDRMQRTGFPPSDPLFQKARRAYDAINALSVELYEMSCKSGASQPQAPADNSNPKRPKPKERVHGRLRSDP
jgi:hypothetical protein